MIAVIIRIALRYCSAEDRLKAPLYASLVLPGKEGKTTVGSRNASV